MLGGFEKVIFHITKMKIHALKMPKYSFKNSLSDTLNFLQLLILIAIPHSTPADLCLPKPPHHTCIVLTLTQCVGQD